ncbi:phosphate/phosphite/phosphonate ABC transporter substrate-binding protein [Rhodococcus sp. T2V]|uniref:phosphate/phosphite/phosphonate ABC transporter substrate-binding protein n=1 Tax=Rhodococcus sp. T2V TaxID=3034164 RepID=UPI0023E0B202|nr:phosphate/phosphite/phosphonate ABC transporter substrate-binding protein [Rhodococcus sp. T2V]MDF3313360.1 phosphate/phosphite/phosphonate ABC transporter substrate-binding protein [Rhodococcus sp. T2V]
MRPYTLAAAGMLGIAVLTLTACQTSGNVATSVADAPITIATLPSSDDPTKVNPIDAFVKMLEEETGREVEVTDVPDYLSVVEAIRTDHVDIGIMSGFPSALAVNTGEVDALLAWKGNGEPVSTCVVKADSPINTVEDLKGKTVAFADQASSSGYFMPVYMLHEAGLEQGKDYTSIFAGGHEGSFAALEQGQVDAACTAVVLTQKGAPIFPFAAGEWRAVGQSPAMDVMGTVLSRQSLDDETRTLLEEALPKVFSEENAEALGGLGSFTGLDVVIAPDPSIFASFAEIAAIAGVELKDLK